MTSVADGVATDIDAKGPDILGVVGTSARFGHGHGHGHGAGCCQGLTAFCGNLL